MQDETPIITPRPRRRWRVPVGWLVALALVAAVGVWWWGNTPHAFRKVATVHLPSDMQTGSYFLWVTPDGPLLERGRAFMSPTRAVDSPWTLTLYDWRGRQRRHLTLPASDQYGKYLVFSPDGRSFAIAGLRKDGLHVASWHRWKPLGTITIPVEKSSQSWEDRMRIQPLDDGRVLLWKPYAKTSPLLAIKGTRIIARGTQTIGKNHEPFNFYQYRRLLTPDGTAMMTYRESVHGSSPSLDYATLTITGSRIKVTPCLTLAKRYCIVQLFPSGGLLCDGNTAITSRGAIPVDPGRRGVPISRRFGEEYLPAYGGGSRIFFCGGVMDVSVRERYILQHREGGNRRSRLYSPATGDAWTIPATDAYTSVFSWSLDGRTVLVDSGMPKGALLELASRIPRLSDLVAARLQQRNNLRVLSLYTRPNRLRAVLLPPFPEDPVSGYLLSPDGRYLVMYHPEDPACTIYAW